MRSIRSNLSAWKHDIRGFTLIVILLLGPTIALVATINPTRIVAAAIGAMVGALAMPLWTLWQRKH